MSYTLGANRAFLSEQHPLVSKSRLFLRSYGSSGVLTDLSPNALSVQHGSAAGADTNDPTWLPYLGTKYLYNTGTNNNFASAPDAAPLQLSTGLDLRIKIAAVDYTHSSAMVLIAKYGSSGSFSYRFQIAATSGALQLTLSSDGTTSNTATSTSAPTVSDGQDIWFRVTWRNSDGRTQFFQSNDGSAWTQIGSDRTISAGATLFNTSSVQAIGATSAGTSAFLGKIYQAQVRSSPDGTIVLDVDFTKMVAPFFSIVEDSANAAVVTLNRSGSTKMTLVDRDAYLLGTDDYFEIADNALLNFGTSDSFSVVMLWRYQGTSSNQVLFSKKDDFNTNTVGYNGHKGSGGQIPNGRISDGTNNVAINFPTTVSVSGQVILTTFIRSSHNDGVWGYLEDAPGTRGADATTATLLNTSPFRIGRLSGAGANYADLEFLGLAVFPWNISTEEMFAVKRIMLGEGWQ